MNRSNRTTISLREFANRTNVSIAASPTAVERRHRSTETAYSDLAGNTSKQPTNATLTNDRDEGNVTLRVVNQTDETVTVEVHLTDTATGDPINTTERSGSIVLDGRRVNTSENGTVVTTVARTNGGLSARYDPGQGQQSTRYVGDSDTMYVQSAGSDLLSVLYRIGVFVAIYFAGMVIVGRFTGWHLWPPWRGL
ncbi:hypothetical protein [Halorussus halophilus]|uniref:hypothetical protein n=1 Tax=Halorussus halophilus TaxID=2650975 RepID=UPI001300FCFD|nr:hypothetical protein [Halorussus halophilus]